MTWLDILTRIRRYLRDPNKTIWSDSEILQYFNDAALEIAFKTGAIIRVEAYNYPPEYEWSYMHDWEAEFVDGTTNQCLTVNQANGMVICQPWESAYWLDVVPTGSDGYICTHPWEMALYSQHDAIPIPLHSKFLRARVMCYDEEPIDPIDEATLAVQDSYYRTRTGTPQNYWRTDEMQYRICLYPHPSPVWDETEIYEVLADGDEDLSVTETLGSGKTYYVAANMDADATVNGLSLVTGDTVLFQRGATWRLSDYFQNAATGIIYGTYGSGNKPVFYGSTDGLTLSWSKYSATVYSTSVTAEPTWVQLGSTSYDYDAKGTDKDAIDGITYFWATEGSGPYTLYVYTSVDQSPALTYPTMLEIPQIDKIFDCADDTILYNLVGKFVTNDVFSGTTVTFEANGCEAYYFYGSAAANGFTNHNTGGIMTLNQCIAKYGVLAVATGGTGAPVSTINDCELGNCYKAAAPGTTTAVMTLNRNYIHDMSVGPVVSANGATVTMNYNILSTSTNASTGYWVYSTAANTTLNLYNNIFVKSAVYAVYAGNGALTLNMYNNIILQPDDVGCLFKHATATYNGDYNLFYRTSAGHLIYFGGSNYTLAQFANYQAAVTPDDANSLAVDPQIENGTTAYTAKNDMRLKKSSPAIGRGTDVSLTLDAWQNTVSSARVDIGANQYTEAALTGMNLSESWLDPRDTGITTDIINTENTLLAIYEAMPADIEGPDDVSDFARYMVKYVEAATLERAYGADTEGYFPTLRDYWGLRKKIGVEALKTFKRLSLKNRNHRLGGGLSKYERRGPQLPSNYPRI